MLLTGSNTGIYRLSDKVGTVYLVSYILPSTSMHFVTYMRPSSVARLYSELSGITETVRNMVHVSIYISFFFLTMTDAMTSQNIRLSSWEE
jgi:hypothetical protein